MKTVSMIGVAALLACVGIVTYAVTANAARSTSPSYIIDSTLDGNFGGSTGSGSYAMTTLGGEAIVGPSASSSYKIASGFNSSSPAPRISVSLQAAGLVTYYAFEEPSGSASYDNSVVGSRATLSSSVTRVAGKVESGVQFDGVDGAATVSAASAPSATTQFSVSGWFLVSGTNNVNTTHLLTDRQASATNRQFSLELIKSSGRVLASSSVSGTTQQITSSVSINDGSWHHIGYMASATNATLYIDGQPSGSFAISGTVDTPTADIRIGGGQFNGIVDEYKLFSRTLSAREVQAEYMAGLAGNRSGIDLGAITPLTAANTAMEVSVRSTGAYGLSIAQDHNLRTQAADVINPISATIASPASWDDSSVRGLGFSVSSAPGIDIKWGSGSRYAQFPNTSTTFYTNNDSTGSSAHTITMNTRVNVASSQPSGEYNNSVTVSGTITP